MSRVVCAMILFPTLMATGHQPPIVPRLRYVIVREPARVGADEMQVRAAALVRATKAWPKDSIELVQAPAESASAACERAPTAQACDIVTIIKREAAKRDAHTKFLVKVAGFPEAPAEEDPHIETLPLRAYSCDDFEDDDVGRASCVSRAANSLARELRNHFSNYKWGHTVRAQ
jgi:hypothetical protein